MVKHGSTTFKFKGPATGGTNWDGESWVAGEVSEIEITLPVPNPTKTHPRNLPAFAPGGPFLGFSEGTPARGQGEDPESKIDAKESIVYMSTISEVLEVLEVLGAGCGESVLNAARRVISERTKFAQAHRRCKELLEQSDRQLASYREGAAKIQAKLDKIALEVMR